MSISVLISAYINCTKDNIEKALNSVFHEQALKPDQIVLVLDGPVGDNLYEFVLLFQKSVECEMIIHPIQKSKGFGNALNEGLKLCTGEYIARQDSDDESMVDRLQMQYDYLVKKKLDACATRSISMQSNRIIPGLSFYISPRILVNFKNPMVHGTLLISRNRGNHGIRI